jgi:23S rRNA (cytidine1920-2'-O)/16S rRNA (cytidine1409-2'-O)-methyltransferase
MTKQKDRLDKLLIKRGVLQSRERAKAMIMAGKVLVNQQRVDKPGTLVCKDAEISLKGEDIPFVSRGGLKLEAALNSAQFDVNGLNCLDIGASTGGFTDCLLQRGAECVFAVDVGYGQLAWKLRNDPRVIVIERANIRYLSKDTIPDPVDLATIDVSFISLRIVVPAVMKFLKASSVIFALIKPQFEVGKAHVGKGGVVRDPALHNAVIEELSQFFQSIHLKCQNVIPSPILGPKGNKEFVMFLRREGDDS